MTAARQLPFLAAAGEMGRLVGAYDWGATALGPIAEWPASLRSAVGIMLESPQSMLMWAGPELLVLYNDAFMARAGRLHPGALGARGEDGFADVWPAIGPALSRVLATGAAVRATDHPLLLQRDGGPKETYWSFSHSPIRDEDGAVLGVFTTADESTDRLLAERRRGTLRALADLATAPIGRADPDEVAVAVVDVLARNPGDLPFAAVCLAGPAPDRDLRVTAAHGIDSGVDGELPPITAPDATQEATRHTLRTGQRVVVERLRARFPGAFPAPDGAPGPLEPDTAVVLPLRAPAGTRAGDDQQDTDQQDTEPIGVLVLGTSPYRALDDDLLAFLDLVEAQCSAAIADAVEHAGERQGSGDGPAGRPSSALIEERERYRTLVTQAPVGIWVTDRRGATTFVNEQTAQLCARPAAELLGTSWIDQIHPEDRETAAAEWAAAVRTGAVWESTHRIVGTDGAVREVRSSACPLRSADGEVTGFLGTTTDVTEDRRAEQMRREAATEHAARKASESAAARLAAMVQGLAAIVWEADWCPDEHGLRFTFVSDRAEELLGHPTARWRDEPDFWPGLIHPDDRAETLRYTRARTAAGTDHDLVYRAVAADGRVLWLHQVVHVVTGQDGRPVAAQGLTVDVTEQQRAERSAALLAETGRLMTQDSSAEERLAELARLVVHDLGDAAVVSVIEVDGLLRRVAVAHDDPVPDALSPFGRTVLPAALEDRLAPGLPVTVPVTDELRRATAPDDTTAPDHTARARPALRACNCLLVPLLIGNRVVGLLSFVNFGTSRHYQPSELDLAAELGRRASLMLAADRQHARERRLQQVSADLASAAGVAEAARLLVARLPDILGADAVGVYLTDPEHGLRLVHGVGYPVPTREEHSTLRPDESLPTARAARTGEPVWIGNPQEWVRDWPQRADRGSATGWPAHAALPLTAVGRVVGVIALDFPTRRTFPADERDFFLALVAQAAPAFERAAAADERRMIAETLQTSLLPPTLPRLDRLPLASRYLPGARGSQAGGDWYDVLPLDGDRVAIAVGDVVGQGAHAAAIMGQLRSALSGYLLEGHEPDQALDRLDRFACRVPGAAGSTVACLTLDPATGELSWARAGHPPPLVAGPSGCRPLEDATGTVLGVRTRPPFTAGTARIEPGESIVLYTDGLVERRGEVVDEGIDRLAGLAARNHALDPASLTDALLGGALDAGEERPGDAGGAPAPADDVALIIARLVPAPLRLVLPAEASRLRELRAAVLEWTSAAGIDDDDLYDLQLAVGEAAANAVEHAYRDRPAGPMSVELARSDDGSITAHVHDEGTWRPVPGDQGFRGRGLELIRDVSTRMQLHHGSTGTQVRFTLPSSDHPAEHHPEPQTDVPNAAPVPAGPATLRIGDAPHGRTVEVHGELDLAGVRGVRDEVLRLAVAGGVLTVDLRPTTYLASAGMALLVEADRAVRSAGGRLRLLAAPANVVRRALAVSGMDDLLEVLDPGS